MVDGERRAVGRDLEERAVVVGEVAGGERADVEDADDAAFDEEGDAEEGADPLLAEDRVEDVAVVDVGDDDRAAFGGDASGEAAADGDADALFDLFLDALRRPRVEHRRGLVEQEERRRVGVEDLRDALEQLGSRASSARCVSAACE